MFALRSLRVAAGLVLLASLASASAGPVVVSGVPDYLWYHGCGPTSLGMILGYWDANGYEYLIPGNSNWSVNLSSVQNVIASSGHVNDYVPMPDVFPPTHTDDCLADFTNTSRPPNAYGWSFATANKSGLEDYSAFTGYTAATAHRTLYSDGASALWNEITAAIDAKQPMEFLVDSSGDGSTDHFVCVIGYDVVGGVKKYACYDTWSTAVRWETFQAMSSSYAWGVEEAIFYTPAGITANRMSWLAGVGNWSTAGAWWAATEPLANYHAVVDNGGTVQITGPGEVCNTLIVGETGAGSGTVEFRAGGVLNADHEYVGYDGRGTVVMAYDADNLIAGNLNIGAEAGSTGLYEQGAGRTKVNTAVNVGIDYGSTGTYRLYGAGVLEAYQVNVGATGVGTFLQEGGTVTVKEDLRVGANGGGSGRYELRGGPLTSYNQVVGLYGQGLFVQTGGTNNLTDFLYLGSESSGSGEYWLKGGVLNIPGRQTGTSYVGGDIIGGQGASRLYIDGGTANLGGGVIRVDYFAIGYGKGANGGYAMAGAKKDIDAEWMVVGGEGTGSYSQNSGTLDVSGHLYAGRYGGGSGTIALGGGTANVEEEDVGYGGAGQVNQSGGTHTVGSNLILARQAGGAGGYQLSGSGVLDTYNVVVGVWGKGDFTQTGGTHTIACNLNLGWYAGSSGTYDLQGGVLNVGGDVLGGGGASTFSVAGGTLHLTGRISGVGSVTVRGAGSTDMGLVPGGVTAGSLVVGAGGSASQTAGTVHVSYLSVEPAGSFAYTGGALHVDGGLAVGGEVNFGGQTLVFGADGFIFRYAGGSVIDGHSVMMNLGPNSLFLTSDPNWDPQSAFGSFTNAGLTHVAGSALALAPGQGFGGSGEISDRVECQGHVEANPGGRIDLAGGLSLSGGGHVDLGGGTLTVGSGTSSLAGGTLWAGDVVVGQAGPATLEILGPAVEVHLRQRLRLGAGAILSVAPGSTIHMAGARFENESTSASALAGLENLQLIFEGGAESSAGLEVAGLVDGGFDANFALQALVLGGPDVGRAVLLDNFDNGNRAPAGRECLFARILTIGEGSRLDVNGCFLYVNGDVENVLDGWVADGRLFSSLSPIDAVYVPGPNWTVVTPEPCSAAVLTLAAAVLLRPRRKPAC